MRKIIFTLLVLLSACVFISCDKDDDVVAPDNKIVHDVPFKLVSVDVFVHPTDETDYNPFYVEVPPIVDTIIYDDWAGSFKVYQSSGITLKVSTDEPGGVCAVFIVDQDTIATGYAEDASYEPLIVKYTW